MYQKPLTGHLRISWLLQPLGVLSNFFPTPITDVHPNFMVVSTCVFRPHSVLPYLCHTSCILPHEIPLLHSVIFNRQLMVQRAKFWPKGYVKQVCFLWKLTVVKWFTLVLIWTPWVIVGNMALTHVIKCWWNHWGFDLFHYLQAETEVFRWAAVFAVDVYEGNDDYKSFKDGWLL